MGTVKLGKDAVAYYGTAGSALSALTTILSGVRDVTLNLGAGKAKTTTRASGGWETELATLRTLGVALKIPLDTTDAGYQALATAFTSSGLLAGAFLTDAKATAGAEGPVGDFSVVKFDRAEPLDGEIMVDVELALAKFTAWNKTVGP